MAGAGRSAAAVPSILRRDECHVWRATPSLARAWHVRLLSPSERDRRERLRRSADRDRFTVGCALLRIALGRLTATAPAAIRLDRSCPDCDRQHGKPVPQDADGLQCSVSHSGDTIVVAVSRDAAIGIDVEEVADGLDDRLVDRVLAAEEIASLNRLPAQDRPWGFAIYWTRKEAILKATGHGLRVSPDQITVSPPAEAPRLLGVEDATLLPAGVALHPLRSASGCVGCLAAIGGALTVLELDGAAVLAEPEQAVARPRA